MIAQLPPLAALAGALGGELAAVLPVQGPAGLGTYEAGVWAGVQSQAPGTFDNAALLGAALAVHALGVVVALAAGLLALTRRAPFPRSHTRTVAMSLALPTALSTDAAPGAATALATSLPHRLSIVVADVQRGRQRRAHARRRAGRAE